MNPSPIAQVVCDQCGEPWDVHTRLARTYDYEEGYQDGEVDLTHCISALKMRNQGPPGPVGAMGATGPKGDPA